MMEQTAFCGRLVRLVPRFSCLVVVPASRPVGHGLMSFLILFGHFFETVGHDSTMAPPARQA